MIGDWLSVVKRSMWAGETDRFRKVEELDAL